MKNKFLPVFVSAVLAGAINSPAQSLAGAGATLTATGTAVSDYMYRGQRLGGVSFQPAVELASAHGALGLWSSFPIEGRLPDTAGPEIDLYGSYILDVGEVGVVPGFTWYTFPDAPTARGFYRTRFEPSLALNHSVRGVMLVPKLYYDAMLDGFTFELSAFYAIPLARIGSELDFTATWGSYRHRDARNGTDPDTKAWGDYWLVGVSAPYQVSSHGRLLLGFSYTEGRRAYLKQGSAGRLPNSLAVGRGVVMLSYSHGF